MFCHWFMADSSVASAFASGQGGQVIALSAELTSVVELAVGGTGVVDGQLPGHTPEPSVTIASAGTAASIVQVKLRAVQERRVVATSVMGRFLSWSIEDAPAQLGRFRTEPSHCP